MGAGDGGDPGAVNGRNPPHPLTTHNWAKRETPYEIRIKRYDHRQPPPAADRLHPARPGGQPLKPGLLHHGQHHRGPLSGADLAGGHRRHHAHRASDGGNGHRAERGCGYPSEPGVRTQGHRSDAPHLCQQLLSCRHYRGLHHGRRAAVDRADFEADGDARRPHGGGGVLSAHQLRHHHLPAAVLPVQQRLPGHGRQHDGALVPDRLRGGQRLSGHPFCRRVRLGRGRQRLGDCDRSGDERCFLRDHALPPLPGNALKARRFPPG